MPRTKGRTSQNRKILSFFRVNFEYLPPYHVLCDGDMIYQSLKNDMYLKQSLSNILNASAQPAITNCVLEDLRGRGSEFSNAALFAKRTTRLPCAHEEKLEVTECLLQRLQTTSEKKLMIAAANVDLLKKLTRIPGIPLISIFNQTKLVLRPPNRITLNYVRDYEKIKTQNISQTDKSLLERIKADGRAKRPERTTIRKKRKAKGPNPLSVKKSTKHSTKRADDPIPKEVQENGELPHTLSAAPSLEVSTFSDSVSAQQRTPKHGKRKRGKRRAGSKQNGVGEDECTPPPRKARRKQLVPVSNIVEDQPMNAIEGHGVRSKESPGADMVSSGVEISGDRTLTQAPREEGQVTNLAPSSIGANALTLSKSKTQDQVVSDENEQEGWKETNACIRAVQVGVAEEGQPNKRKKQRKNRRRRPSKKQ